MTVIHFHATPLSLREDIPSSAGTFSIASGGSELTLFLYQLQFGHFMPKQSRSMYPELSLREDIPSSAGTFSIASGGSELTLFLYQLQFGHFMPKQSRSMYPELSLREDTLSSAGYFLDLGRWCPSQTVTIQSSVVLSNCVVGCICPSP